MKTPFQNMNDENMKMKDDEQFYTELYNDLINAPAHYTQGKFEPIDYMRDKLTSEQFEGYCAGNVIKYISRYRHKNGAEDIRKLIKYATWLTEELEGRDNGG